MKIASASASIPGLVAIAIAFSCSAVAEQFTIRCARDGYYFLTFDTERRRVVYEIPERENARPKYKGHITSVTEHEIQMEFLVGGRPPVLATLDRRRGTLQGNAEAAAGRTPSFVDCTQVELRPALAWFDKLYPYE